MGSADPRGPQSRVTRGDRDDGGSDPEASLNEPLLTSVSDETPPALQQQAALSSSGSKATSFGTGVNITNNVVGAGMLSLPFVLKEASFAFGLVIIATVCAAAALSFYMLACCCEMTGHSDYRRIGAAAFGPRMGTAIQAVVLCYTTLACISFCILLGDLAPDVVADLTDATGPVFYLLGARVPAMVAIGLLVLLPMSCARDLSAFQHSSALALCCDGVAMGVVVMRFLLPSESRAPAQVAEGINWCQPGLSLLTTIPIVVVAANSHYNAPRYYQELQDRSTRKIAAILICSLCVCGSVYVAVAVSGYLEFGPATKGDIFLSYDSNNDSFATAGRAALSLHLAMTFPLIFNAMRRAVHILFFTPGTAADVELTRLQATMYTVFLVPPILAVSVCLPEISTVFSFNGSLFGALIVYIFPSVMYARLVKRFCPETSWYWAVGLPGAVASWGIFMMIGGVSVTTLQKTGVL